jgi:hypothetical protein
MACGMSPSSNSNRSPIKVRWRFPAARAAFHLVNDNVELVQAELYVDHRPSRAVAMKSESR